MLLSASERIRRENERTRESARAGDGGDKMIGESAFIAMAAQAGMVEIVEVKPDGN